MLSNSAPLPSQIASIVLSTSPQTLTKTLISHLHAPTLTPVLIHSTLKLLSNDAPRALLFFKSLLQLKTLTLNPSSFDLALDIAARSRDRNTLTLLLNHLRPPKALTLTPKSFAILAERFVSHKNPNRAVKLFLNLHHHGLNQDLNTFNMLLDALTKFRRVEMASNLLRDLKGRFKPDVISYNIIADGWCRVKKMGRAVEVMKEMVELGLEPSLSSYNILLNGYFRAGQVRQGWEFFVEMKRRGREEGGCRTDIVSYTTVVHGLGIEGQIEKARKVFDGMVGEGVLPSVATYNALIQVICKKGSVENALLVFDEMVKKGYTPNVITYNLVIRGLSHTGKMNRAMEFLERMKFECCEPNVQTYNILIRYSFEEGEIEKALELFDTMNKNGTCLPNVDTYNVVISAMFARKRSEDMLVAGKMVVEMIERGHLPTRFVFNRVLNGLLLTGNQSFAKELLRMQDRFGRLRKGFRL